MSVININFENISHESYQRFVNYAFENCDSVRFSFKKYLKIHDIDSFDDIIEFGGSADELRQYENNVATFDKSLSEFEDISKDDIIKKDIYGNYTCNCSDKLKRYMLSKTSLDEWRYPELPEDICFFKTGIDKEWFYSISHEQTSIVFTDDINDLLSLYEMGLISRSLIYNSKK